MPVWRLKLRENALGLSFAIAARSRSLNGSVRLRLMCASASFMPVATKLDGGQSADDRHEELEAAHVGRGDQFGHHRPNAPCGLGREQRAAPAQFEHAGEGCELGQQLRRIADELF